MPWTLPLLLSCAFVEPAPPEVALDPPQEVLDRIDAQRRRLQGTDPGAELWRSVDAHGGLLRYERVGPWTAELADGRTVAPGDPLHGLLTRPFSLVNTIVAPEAPMESGELVVRTAEGEALHLDPVGRELLGWTQGDALHEVVATRDVQGLRLITELATPDGHVVVERWAPADPLPGWPLDD